MTKITCDECGREIKKRGWRLGLSIDVYCTLKCMKKQMGFLYNKLSVDDMADDSSIILWQKTKQEQSP